MSVAGELVSHESALLEHQVIEDLALDPLVEVGAVDPPVSKNRARGGGAETEGPAAEEGLLGLASGA